MSSWRTLRGWMGPYAPASWGSMLGGWRCGGWWRWRYVGGLWQIGSVHRYVYTHKHKNTNTLTHSHARTHTHAYIYYLHVCVCVCVCALCACIGAAS